MRVHDGCPHESLECLPVPRIEGEREVSKQESIKLGFHKLSFTWHSYAKNLGLFRNLLGLCPLLINKYFMRNL